jgi:hypothetical protein
VNLHGQIVDVRDEKLPLRVECTAAPIHSSKIAGNGHNAPHVRRSEDSVRSQARKALSAGVSLGIRGPPGIAHGKPLTNKGRWSDREWLRRRGLFLVGFALRNGPLFYLEHRSTGFTIKNKEIASLIPLNDHRQVCSIAVQSG